MNEKSLTPLRDEDYEAIEAAVMETARGRWFLAEFAVRNRSADTRVLLDAIQRLENTVRSERGGSVGNGDMDRVRLDLADMASAIDRTKQEIAEIQGDTEEGGRFNMATNELDAIVNQTEKATQDILNAAEMIQELAWTLRERHAEADISEGLDAHATEIYTACSFQDLTGQRIRKVVNVLTYLEAHIRRMITIWNEEGGGLDGAEHAASAGSAGEAHPDAHLLNGPQLEGQGIDQSAVDDLMADDPFEAAPQASDDLTTDPMAAKAEDDEAIADEAMTGEFAADEAPAEGTPDSANDEAGDFEVADFETADAGAESPEVGDAPLEDADEAVAFAEAAPEEMGADETAQDDDTAANDIFAVADAELDEIDFDAIEETDAAPVETPPEDVAAAADDDAFAVAANAEDLDILDMQDDESVFEGLEESLADDPVPDMPEVDLDSGRPVLAETAADLALQDGPGLPATPAEAGSLPAGLSEADMAQADVFASFNHTERAALLNSGDEASAADADMDATMDSGSADDAMCEPEDLTFIAGVLERTASPDDDASDFIEIGDTGEDPAPADIQTDEADAFDAFDVSSDDDAALDVGETNAASEEFAAVDDQTADTEADTMPSGALDDFDVSGDDDAALDVSETDAASDEFAAVDVQTADVEADAVASGAIDEFEALGESDAIGDDWATVDSDETTAEESDTLDESAEAVAAEDLPEPDLSAIVDMMTEQESEADPTARLTEAERIALFR